MIKSTKPTLWNRISSKIIAFLLVATVIGCDRFLETKSSVKELTIKDPRLTSLNYDDSELDFAVSTIKNHLSGLSINIDSMYLIGLDTTSNKQWLFSLVHYNCYLEYAKLEAEERRIDSLSNLGIKSDFQYIPPTGNWGGEDRTIYYSPTDRKIKLDVIAQ